MKRLKHLLNSGQPLRLRGLCERHKMNGSVICAHSVKSTLLRISTVYVFCYMMNCTCVQLGSDFFRSFFTLSYSSSILDDLHMFTSIHYVILFATCKPVLSCMQCSCFSFTDCPRAYSHDSHMTMYLLHPRPSIRQAKMEECSRGFPIVWSPQCPHSL